jgi:tetratricopeptide (TPR) repeat protein
MAPDKVERLLQRAQEAIAQRDWEKAKQVYLMALAVRTDVPDIHYGLATVFFQLREMTSAAHHFREVTRLDPQRASAYVNLGAVLNMLNQYDDAIAALRRALQIDGQRVEAYYNLGVVYRRKGQPDLALAAYKEAIRLNPRMADAHLNLGNIFLEKDMFRPAIQHYEQALAIRPGWDKALDGLTNAKAGMSPGERPAAPPATAARSAGHLDHPVDPVSHGPFLTTLHQATIVAEETGRSLAHILNDEIEPAIKELSNALLHPHGPRSELEACVNRFETALSKMRSTRQALKSQVTRLADQGEHFPTS